jgi:hypothetical protein
MAALLKTSRTQVGLIRRTTSRFPACSGRRRWSAVASQPSWSNAEVVNKVGYSKLSLKEAAKLLLAEPVNKGLCRAQIVRAGKACNCVHSLAQAIPG